MRHADLRMLLPFWLMLFTVCLSKAEIQFGYTKIIFAGQNYLVTPVSANHSSATWWLVDTGAPRSVIDPELAIKLGLRPAATIKASSHDADLGSAFPIVITDDLQVGTFHCGKTACVERSIKSIKGITTTVWTGKFDKTGIVGMDLLRRYGAIINIRAGKIFFSRFGNLGMTREGYEKMGFTYVPLTVTPNLRLEIVGTLAGQDYSFFIDTGSTTIFEEWLRNNAKIPFSNSGRMTFPFTDVKNVRVTSGVATDFKFAGYDAKGATLHFAPINLADHGLNGFSHPLAGIIGIDFLYYRSALIDIGGRALYLKQSTSRR